MGFGSGFIGCRVDSSCVVFIGKLCFCKELRRVLPEFSDLLLGLFECGESALNSRVCTILRGFCECIITTLVCFGLPLVMLFCQSRF